MQQNSYVQFIFNSLCAGVTLNVDPVGTLVMSGQKLGHRSNQRKTHVNTLVHDVYEDWSEFWCA